MKKTVVLLTALATLCLPLMAGCGTPPDLTGGETRAAQTLPAPARTAQGRPSPSPAPTDTPAPTGYVPVLPEEIAVKLAAGCDAWDAVMPASVPKPDGVRFELSTADVRCLGFDEESFKAYKKSLVRSGFVLAGEVPRSYFSHSYGGDAYIKGSLLVQISADLDSINNIYYSVAVYARQYLQRSSVPDGAVSGSQALRLVNAYLRDNSLVTKNAAFALEYDIPGLFGKTGMQAFEICGETRAPDVRRYSSIYVIYQGVVSPLYAPLVTPCIADVDHDGAYELLTIYGMGSGFYRIEMPVYGIDESGRLVSEPGGAGFVPDAGFAMLYIEAEGETDVRMWGADRWFNELYKTVDYVLLRPDADGALRPVDLDNFPFNHSL